MTQPYSTAQNDYSYCEPHPHQRDGGNVFQYDLDGDEGGSPDQHGEERFNGSADGVFHGSSSFYKNPPLNEAGAPLNVC